MSVYIVSEPFVPALINKPYREAGSTDRVYQQLFNLVDTNDNTRRVDFSIQFDEIDGYIESDSPFMLTYQNLARLTFTDSKRNRRLGIGLNKNGTFTPMTDENRNTDFLGVRAAPDELRSISTDRGVSYLQSVTIVDVASGFGFASEMWCGDKRDALPAGRLFSVDIRNFEPVSGGGLQFRARPNMRELMPTGPNKKAAA